MMTARVHHAARRRGGGVAARGARAAAGEAADHWVPGREHAGGARPAIAAFVQRLRELGWIEGRNVAIEFRWAEGRSERFAEIAAEFVRLKVDVIVTHEPRPSSQPSRRHRSSRSCSRSAGDPVGTGLVASLARPGGNVTGCRPGRPILSASDSNSCARLCRVFAGWRSWPMSAFRICAGNGRGSGEQPARSLSKSPRSKSGEPKISRPRSRRSRAARTRFMLSPTRSQSATECASIRWRWARDCRRCTVSGSRSKQAV